MATSTLHQRASDEPSRTRSKLYRTLGHPAAYVATAALLLLLFGWTFFANSQRVAPTKDPAYYTWRTEALISEKPVALLDIEGPFSIFAGGYRITAPVIGGFLRHVPGVAPLSTTSFLMVGLPVLIALLLGGFAYTRRRDPLIFHAVALGAGSLLLTPPFVGYLDNMLCLFFLAAALPFIEPSRRSWPARVAFGMLLLVSGLTHPTTLAFFCIVLGAMAVARLVYRRFDLRSTVRDDAPMLLTAVVAAVLTYVIWKAGIWGRSASLSEAALAPPYDSSFFLDRMRLWVDAMRPALNGPLFILGAVGLLAAGRRAAEDEVARVSLIWLAPLAGLFGFLGGLTYPYYRFFNSTLAWVLLVGVGIYFAARFFIDRASRGGASALALLGVVALGVIVATNFTRGFESSGWNNPTGGWLSAQERTDLDVLRAALAAKTDPARPVVFVVDDEANPPFQIYGFTKLAGNTSRYGLPPGQIDRGYLYLGSLQGFLDDRATCTDTPCNRDVTYDKLSLGFLDDTRRGIAASGADPLIVVATDFNQTGANAELATGGSLPADAGSNVWVLSEGDITVAGGASIDVRVSPPKSSVLHIVRVVAGLLLLLLPGLLALRWFLPGAGLAVGLGLAPALAAAMLALAGTLVLAVARSPFSTALSLVSLGITSIAGALLWAAGRRAARPQPASA